MTDDTTTLIHEDGENYRSDGVSINYDGRVRTLDVAGDGSVEASNRMEVEELVNGHGSFFKVNQEEDTGHVLDDRTVDEVKDYVETVNSVDRLKELRQFEDRKTGQEVIDRRIAEVRNSDESTEQGG